MSFIVKLMAKCCGDWIHHKSGEKKYQCFFIFKVDTRLCVCRYFPFLFSPFIQPKATKHSPIFWFSKKIYFFKKAIDNSEIMSIISNVVAWHRTLDESDTAIIDAAVAELADAHVWGACGQPYGFKSHQPHQEKKKSLNATFSFCTTGNAAKTITT